MVVVDKAWSKWLSIKIIILALKTIYFVYNNIREQTITLTYDGA